jgi:hypothetical protein
MSNSSMINPIPVLVLKILISSGSVLTYQNKWFCESRAVLYFYKDPPVPVPKNKLERFQFHTQVELGIWFRVQFFKT